MSALHAKEKQTIFNCNCPAAVLEVRFIMNFTTSVVKLNVKFALIEELICYIYKYLIYLIMYSCNLLEVYVTLTWISLDTNVF